MRMEEIDLSQFKAQIDGIQLLKPGLYKVSVRTPPCQSINRLTCLPFVSDIHVYILFELIYVLQYAGQIPRGQGEDN